MGHERLDLNWMGKPDNLHVGFMQASRDKYASLFVNLGYQVIIVDQSDHSSAANTEGSNLRDRVIT